jgi:hypothetical protein
MDDETISNLLIYVKARLLRPDGLRRAPIWGRPSGRSACNDNIERR